MAKKQRQHVRKVSNDTNSGVSTHPEPSNLDASLDSVIHRIDEDSEHLPLRDDSGESIGEMNETSTRDEPSNKRRRGFTERIKSEKDGIFWIIGCAFLGAFIGFGVGCGWFTYGYGSYQTVVHDIQADGSHTLVRQYIISSWRVALAEKVRASLYYKLLMTNTTDVNLAYGEGSGFLTWIKQLWPANWMLSSFDSVNLQKFEVGENPISPITASFLSFVLPWRRPLIKKLAGSGQGNVSPPSQMPSTLTSSDPIDPYYHPIAFHILREHIIRHKRGYVHPDLGFLVPAPSGAARGIGMTRDSYNQCQINCYPGTTEESLASSREYLEEKGLMEEMKELYPEITADIKRESYSSSIPTPKTTTLKEVQDVLHKQATSTEHPYTQQTLMMRIPLEAQITRKTALEILNPLLPEELKAMTPLEHLDDAFLLALLLVYEGGLKSNSRFWPYISTLPPHPSCAMHRAWRQSIVDVLSALALEMGTDIHGWPNEIAKASDFMDKIAGGLVHFAAFFEFDTTMFKSLHEALRWSLCQVASRGIAGNEEYGRLRLVPMMDMINHDEAADMFVELKGNESALDGHFVGAFKEDAGAFVVRSMRHDRRKVLKEGQELMANYNVPHYSALDWFLNMGYVPPEREGRYTMLDAGLPRDRRSKYKSPVSG